MRLAEHISFQTCGEIILVSVVHLGNGYEHNVLGVTEFGVPDIGRAFKSVCAANVEQLLAFADELGVLAPVKERLIENKTVLAQLIHKVHGLFKALIIKVGNQLTVSQFNGSNAAGEHKGLFIEPAVQTVLVSLGINIFKKHILECGPCPFALVKQLNGILKALGLDGLLVVDNDLACCCLGSHKVMLALEAELVVKLLYRVPKVGIEINIAVVGLKLTVGDTLGERVKVAACDEVDACTAQNVCGKVGKALAPCGGDIFNGSAVLLLEKLERKRLGVA